MGITGKWKKERRGSASKSEMVIHFYLLKWPMHTLYKLTFCFSKHLPLVDENFCSTRVLPPDTLEKFSWVVKQMGMIRQCLRRWAQTRCQKSNH
jgi:hypothetical protein